MKHPLIALVATIAVACAAALAPALAGAQAEPTEAELREAYPRWVDNLGSHEYLVRHILVAKRGEAEAALAEIQAGASFGSVAERVSKDTGTRSRGGDLGWVTPAHFVAEFRVALRGTNKGLHPLPVATAFGWHVILVEQTREVNIPRYEEARPALLAALKRDRTSGVSTAPASAPQRTAEQLDALWFAAHHTMGITSYVYRQAQYPDRDAAARASRLGLLLTPESREHKRARHLIEVEPALRWSLARLLTPDTTSPPIERTLADGRTVWVVLQLVRRDSAPRLQSGATFEADAALWVAKGLLPDPQALIDKAARARVAYWRARSVEDLQAIPTELSPDVDFGNTSTPLLDAMVRRDMAMAKALVARGADVNRCGLWGCPVAFAARFEDAAQSLSWTDWLLAAGARPDATDSRGPNNVFATALSAAAWHGFTPVVERLVAAGASLDGVKDGIDTPLEAAASAGRRALIEWLIARGASVLPRPSPKGMGMTSLAQAAYETKDEAFVAWAEKLVLDAAAKQPELAFEMHFEQQGKRLVADASGLVALKAAPFKMVFRLHPKAGDVQVGGSIDSAWLDEVRKRDLRNAMFRPFAAGVLADTSKPDSQTLLLSRACPAQVKPDQTCSGVFMALGMDESPRRDFHERRKLPNGATAYVRAINEVIDFPVDDSARGLTMSIDRLAGQTLHLAMGVPVAIGGGDGLRFVKPQYATLAFSR